MSEDQCGAPSGPEEGGSRGPAETLREASRAASRGETLRACRLAREAARAALAALVESVGGVGCRGSIVGTLRGLEAAGVEVPPRMFEVAHILDPHMGDARKLGAQEEAGLGEGHGEECVEAARSIIAWASGALGGR